MQPTFLVAATTWWPLSAQLTLSLLGHGCTVEALCPPGHPLRYVSGVKRYHLYRRVTSLSSLKNALAAARPEIVIPCDDGVVRQLHQLYREHPELRRLIARSLGAAAHFEIVDSREQLHRVAQELHIRVPQTERVKSTEDLRRWFECGRDTAVLKQNGTWGGNGVRVVHSVAEAAHMLAKMMRPTPWTVAWKRMIINRDPIALWSCRENTTPVVTVQQFIRGRPANMMMACWKGRILGAVTVEVLWSQGATGAALVVRLIDHAEMAHAACKLVKRLELSGFHGLDFILAAESGAAYLIELNPRCTQLGHLPLAGRGDLVSLLCAKMGTASPQTSNTPRMSGLTIGDTVAFFPKAFRWNPASRYVRGGYQDTPWDEPALMKELLKQDWPDRQWQARLYHRLRPPRQEKPETFDETPILDDPDRYSPS